jgi:transcriptional regulator with XRE-family HTH domain
MIWRMTHRIAKLLTERHMSQTKLAALIGMSQPHLSRLMKGIGTFTPGQIKAIADALGCSEFDVIENYEPALDPLELQMVRGMRKLSTLQRETLVRHVTAIVEPEMIEQPRRKTG